MPAKVNLALRVGGTDEQGYHALGTVFQAVSLGDEVTAEAAPAGVFRLSFQGEGAAFLPVDDTNLAMRSAKLLAERFRRRDVGVTLLIRKRIPVAGGMAGGSADAAAVLVACNALWEVGATREDLHELAAAIGSDVPFLLMGGTAIGTGRGDLLTLRSSPAARSTGRWRSRTPACPRPRCSRSSTGSAAPTTPPSPCPCWRRSARAIPRGWGRR